MDCPSYEDLAQAAFAHTVPAETERHLHGGCMSCVARWGLLSSLREALDAGELPPVPDHLRRAAESIMEIAPAAGPRPLARLVSSLKVLVADLVPHAGGGLIPSMRSATGRARRMLYRAGDYEIDLAVTPERTLMGQIIVDSGGPIDDAWCTLVGAGVVQAAIRDTGEFSFTEVPTGTVSLTFEWGDTRVLLPEVELPE